MKQIRIAVVIGVGNIASSKPINTSKMPPTRPQPSTPQLDAAKPISKIPLTMKPAANSQVSATIDATGTASNHIPNTMARIQIRMESHQLRTALRTVVTIVFFIIG